MPTSSSDSVSASASTEASGLLWVALQGDGATFVEGSVGLKPDLQATYGLRSPTRFAYHPRAPLRPAFPDFP